MASPDEIANIFTAQNAIALNIYNTARTALGEAFKVFQDDKKYQYEPYEWTVPQPPIIGFDPVFDKPIKPGAPKLDKAPGLEPLGEITNPEFGNAPEFKGVPPKMDYPPVPGTAPTDPTSGQMPHIYQPSFPPSPSLMPLPSMALPYPYITVPPAPKIVMPVFDGTVPDPIHQITFQEYMDKLTEAYDKYSQDIPNMVYANWMKWFKAYLGERPLIDKLAGIISQYLDTGGAGIPIPIEEAIVTRATDRVVAEQRRATMNVYDSAVKRGLLLPSGTLVAGLKEARQASSEAVSKVATDVAIENLKLEHAHMQFMLKLGSELEQWVATFAVQTAKTVLDANAQAIEMTKFVLTGMIEINNIMVKIYLAQWEAYKAAVEIYKARITAIEAEIRIYEAQIKAELAKVEINKAYVEMMTLIVNANKSIVEMYKVQVDAESVKVESSRVAVMAFEAGVRAYVARVEGWKAQWSGYTARIEGEVAKMKGYEAEVSGYTALVNAYRATIEGYTAKVRAEGERIRAVGQQNEENLKAWSTQMELWLKEYVAQTEAYKAEWGGVAEIVRGVAEGTRIVADSLFKGYEVEARIDTERAREHLSEWNASLQAMIQSANGLTQTAHVASDLAAAALNSITAFSGQLVNYAAPTK